VDAGQDPAELLSAAVEDYAEAERLAPESPEVVVQRAMMYFTLTGYEVRLKQNPLDDFAKGDAEFAKAIALDPALSKAWVQRGRLRHLRADYLRRRGENPDPDYDEADRLLIEAARLDPMSRALKHLGDVRDDRANHAMNRGGDPKAFLDAAEEAYTKAIQSAASPAPVHVSRGFSRLRRGRYLESRKEIPSARDTYRAALEDFREAIRLSPENSGGAKDGIAEAEARLAALGSP
jgi:tetratricopeptide (TPR) repeat protein